MIAMDGGGGRFVFGGVEFVTELGFNGGEKGFGGPAMLQEKEFESGLFAGLPEDFALLENFGDSADDGNHLVPLDEGVEFYREVGLGGKAAGDAEGKTNFFAAMAGATRGGEADVINFGVGAPVGAAGDGDFVLAREIVELGITGELLVERENERRNVCEFMFMNAGERAAGDVAGDVAASAGGGEAGGPEAIEDLGKIFDGHPVELDILADSDIGDAVAVLI